MEAGTYVLPAGGRQDFPSFIQNGGTYARGPVMGRQQALYLFNINKLSKDQFRHFILPVSFIGMNPYVILNCDCTCLISSLSGKQSVTINKLIVS
ncbi:MAG TPA: hypothetical protein VJ161_08180 [Geobacteraceae bacterium]|nr:hypothetical protein [Geobacteraceae bacterium]